MFAYEGFVPNVVLDLLPEKGQRIFMQTTPGWIHSGTDFLGHLCGPVGSETTIGSFEGFDTKESPSSPACAAPLRMRPP